METGNGEMRGWKERIREVGEIGDLREEGEEPWEEGEVRGKRRKRRELTRAGQGEDKSCSRESRMGERKGGGAGVGQIFPPCRSITGGAAAAAPCMAERQLRPRHAATRAGAGPAAPPCMERHRRPAAPCMMERPNVLDLKKKFLVLFSKFVFEKCY